MNLLFVDLKYELIHHIDLKNQCRLARTCKMWKRFMVEHAAKYRHIRNWWIQAPKEVSTTTLWMDACINGWLEAAQFLIGQCGTINRNKVFIACCIACANGYLKIVKWLVKSFDINYISWNMIDITLKRKHVNTVYWICKNVSENNIDTNNWEHIDIQHKICLLCIRFNDPKRLVEFYPTYRLGKKFFEEAFRKACKYGSYECLKFILEDVRIYNYQSFISDIIYDKYVWKFAYLSGNLNVLDLLLKLLINNYTSIPIIVSELSKIKRINLAVYDWILTNGDSIEYPINDS